MDPERVVRLVMASLLKMLNAFERDPEPAVGAEPELLLELEVEPRLAVVALAAARLDEEVRASGTCGGRRAGPSA